MESDPTLFAVVLLSGAASFFVSASAGMGGSLVLVPVLALSLGTKEGIALAALLLAGNNVFKVLAYRKTLPFKTASLVILLTLVGAYVGAHALVVVPDIHIGIAVVIALVSTFVLERRKYSLRAGSPALALASGITSGVSGTSGPLKAIALRSLGLSRDYLVGAACLVSLAGDAIKTVVFVDAELLGTQAWTMGAASIPVMCGSTFAGRQFNRAIGERGYGRLFWAVMGGYAIRLIVSV